MKNSIWDILTMILLLGIVIVAVGVLMLFQNPYLVFNPFPPPPPVPTIFVPSFTPTPKSLPPTWTPTAFPTLISEATKRPTSTPLPTNTPFVLPSPTPILKTVYPTNARLPLEGKCKVLAQSPEDGKTIKAGETFRVSWTLQNTSTEPWRSDSIDVRFKGGVPMHTSKDVIDLPKSVEPNGTIDITITMTAPEKAGYQITYWTLSAGSTVKCTFYVEIFVEK
ncbi:NBR1-Ig-like domain-containing protein [Anaerolinea thermophila]|nr:NBR1-Ig-like domain-containing protein [Anaerolinea thermophila]